MTGLHLSKYRVTVLADGESHTLSIYAPGKLQAGFIASKQAKTLLGARVVEIKRVREIKDAVKVI